jgi:prephenate dehydratase
VTRVAFLGPPGTFTEEALLSDAELAGRDLVAIDSIPEVVAAVERGDADFGVVPVENSIEGSVNVTLDLLDFESDLLIQGEIVRPVSLSLLARPGTKLKDVRTVISFPTATAQCRDWLNRRLPKAEVAAANSTAGAAEQVARSRAQGVAAIGTHLAAELYGLDALASDIEDHPDNATRFLVVGRGVPAPTAYDKTTIVCYQRRNQPGSLVSILQEFAARSINLTRLESRPTKEGLGSYCFVIDCEGHVTDELVGDVLRNLAAKQGGVKFLGSYPAASTEAGRARRHTAGQAWRDAVRWVEELRAGVRVETASADGRGSDAARAPRAGSRRTPRT